MRKLSLLAAGLAALLISAGNASAQTYNGDWYAGLSGDLTWLRHSNMGGGGNIQLGYRFFPSNLGDVRIEAEAGYHEADGSGNYSSTHYFSYMGNVYYDFTGMLPPSSSGFRVVPYVGVGLGDAAIHYGHSSFSGTFHNHDNEFAWNGMVGLRFVTAYMPNADWSLGYRYMGTSGDNIRSNNLELGYTMHF
jgi:hypothetical protein